ncbi:TetR/AcrR family transcriptional regulator [Flavobacterium sp.]|uniref:TetR/AcrR family transcriptional regulator n=1 Tax=Flavobacterium sp. TaxID=239 RepID=UPI0028BDE566|nr:TetR/AcrR family transcriptional regulator [Flavobacterium sp.]
MKKDETTEERIKEAARVVFMKKGYAATRTRDIADEAGINLALLNYYFRSKEKLFHQVIFEKVQQIFGVLFPVLTNESLTLEDKVQAIVETYTKMLLENPDLPIFVFSELKNNPQLFDGRIKLDAIVNSSFAKQLYDKKPEVNPVHFMISVLGLTVFPFLAKPMMFASGMATNETFEVLMDERRTLIPHWVKILLEKE